MHPKTYIIAEIGVNHNNKIELAKKIVDIAKKAGADAVKFQTFVAEDLAHPNTPKVSYQKKNFKDKESHFQMLKRLELSKLNHFKIYNYCKKKNIEFISTPYDVNSAKFLKKLNVKIFKVSSADLIDHKLHDYLSKTKKKIIISTGMATFSEIKKTLKIYKKNNTYNNVTLLHCVSNYPCSDASLNLLNIKSLYKNFSLPIGFSDHTVGFTAAPLSIALGATVIEKHVTIRNNMAGPDHKTSLNAKDFIKFVKIIKKTEKTLGSLKKITQAEELPMKNISRKSLFYSKSLTKNTILKEHHIKPLRPATGILADKYFNFLGKKLVTDVKFNQKISFDHVKKK